MTKNVPLIFLPVIATINGLSNLEKVESIQQTLWRIRKLVNDNFYFFII